MIQIPKAARPRRVFSHIERPVINGIKYRSKMEANYALYLAWLKKLGEIDDWSYETSTFWFTPDAVSKGGVRRGVTSYKPDFQVISKLKNGRVLAEFHEVKGWMDTRSRVALKRMTKYYPTVKVVVVDSKQMAALKRQVGAIVGMI